MATSRMSLTALYLTSALLPLNGCKPMSHDQAAVCAAPETARGLVAVAFEGSGLPPSDIQLNFDAPVLASYDAGTRKATCTATLRLAFTGSLANLDAAKGSALLANGAQVDGVPGADVEQLLSTRQNYSVQPSADGKGLVYTLGSSVIAALKAWTAASQTSAPGHNAPRGKLPSVLVTTTTPTTDSHEADDPGSPTAAVDLPSASWLREMSSAEVLDDPRIKSAFPLLRANKEAADTVTCMMGEMPDPVKIVDGRYILGSGSAPPACRDGDGAYFVLDTQTGGVVLAINTTDPSTQQSKPKVLFGTPDTVAWDARKNE